MSVCYHHGGRSRRGFAHPNYKHGYYCKQPDIWLMLVFANYRREARHQQRMAVLAELEATMPRETYADTLRLLAAYRAAVARLPDVKLTPALAAMLCAGNFRRNLST